MVKLRHHCLFKRVSLTEGENNAEIERKFLDFTINGYCRLEYMPHIVNGTGGPLYQIIINNELFTKAIVHEVNMDKRTIHFTNPYIKMERDWLLHNYKVYISDEVMYTCEKKIFERYYRIEIPNKNFFVHSLSIAVALDMLSHLD
ncbi:MAG: hypothetical protein GX660_19840 [Clostridiaceae bacterium]|nr:hypothetical protein [Clostridiaceae bacterium]